MNYDKDSIIFTCTVVIVFAIITIINFIFAGCATTSRPIDRTEQQLIRDFAKFEESFESIDRRVERAQTIASTISDEVERAIYLFEQYDSIIREYRAEIDKYRKSIEQTKE